MFEIYGKKSGKEKRLRLYIVSFRCAILYAIKYFDEFYSVRYLNEYRIRNRT